MKKETVESIKRTEALIKKHAGIHFAALKREESICVETFLKGMPHWGGTVKRETIEMIIKMAFMAGAGTLLAEMNDARASEN